eukprot:7958622-Pyramimonas_sp.AAC.1
MLNPAALPGRPGIPMVLPRSVLEPRRRPGQTDLAVSPAVNRAQGLGRARPPTGGFWAKH